MPFCGRNSVLFQDGEDSGVECKSCPGCPRKTSRWTIRKRRQLPRQLRSLSLAQERSIDYSTKRPRAGALASSLRASDSAEIPGNGIFVVAWLPQCAPIVFGEAEQGRIVAIDETIDASVVRPSLLEILRSGDARADGSLRSWPLTSWRSQRCLAQLARRAGCGCGCECKTNRSLRCEQTD
ncbi:hypothetical protein E4U48_000503 [Claviceps purpurea]|nr:hypothetical protein E4U48_000503 [Claviceps purpurea]